MNMRSEEKARPKEAKRDEPDKKLDLLSFSTSPCSSFVARKLEIDQREKSLRREYVHLEVLFPEAEEDVGGSGLLASLLDIASCTQLLALVPGHFVK